MFRGVSIVSSIRNSAKKALTARSIQPCRITRTAFSTAENADNVQLKIEYKNMADGLILGDRACLARLITLIESQRGK
jgi:PIN domain nuclease of toxin-antitoxin system